MATFTKFAIVGAGGVGSGVVDSLLKANMTVTILTRDDAKVSRKSFGDALHYSTPPSWFAD
jgi:Trk K+ transport system NAD-binding subunit